MPDIDSFSIGEKKGECIAFFHYEQRVDDAASDEAGHPVYKDVPYVQIISPGNDKEIVDRKVKDEDKERWPREWHAFLNREEIQYDGTPLKEWPQITKAQAATLEAMKIFTVEQLSEVADQNIGNLGMGMMDLKNKAKAYLEWQAGESSLQKYAQRNRRQQERIDQLEQQVAALEEKLSELSAASGTPSKPKSSKRGSAKK